MCSPKIVKPYLWRADCTQSMFDGVNPRKGVEIDGVVYYVHDDVYDYIIQLHTLIDEYESMLDDGGD